LLQLIAPFLLYFSVLGAASFNQNIPPLEAHTCGRWIDRQTARVHLGGGRETATASSACQSVVCCRRWESAGSDRPIPTRQCNMQPPRCPVWICQNFTKYWSMVL